MSPERVERMLESQIKRRRCQHWIPAREKTQRLMGWGRYCQNKVVPGTARCRRHPKEA